MFLSTARGPNTSHVGTPYTSYHPAYYHRSFVAGSMVCKYIHGILARYDTLMTAAGRERSDLKHRLYDYVVVIEDDLRLAPDGVK